MFVCYTASCTHNVDTNTPKLKSISNALSHGSDLYCLLIRKEKGAGMRVRQRSGNLSICKGRATLLLFVPASHGKGEGRKRNV